MRHSRRLLPYKDNLRDMSAAFSETCFLFCDVYFDGPKSANDFSIVRVNSSLSANIPARIGSNYLRICFVPEDY